MGERLAVRPSGISIMKRRRVGEQVERSKSPQYIHRRDSIIHKGQN